jgi:hypothetical protein
MQELHNATKNQNIFRITKLVFDKDNKEFIVIAKSIGKNIKFEENARTLYEDNATLQGFSQLDVKVITYLACETNNLPQYSIQNLQYDSSSGTTIIFIKKVGEEGLMRMTAKELLNSDIFPAKFSKADILKVGYELGEENNRSED